MTAKIQGTKLGCRKAKRFRMVAFKLDVFLLITPPHPDVCDSTVKWGRSRNWVTQEAVAMVRFVKFGGG